MEKFIIIALLLKKTYDIVRGQIIILSNKIAKINIHILIFFKKKN